MPIMAAFLLAMLSGCGPSSDSKETAADTGGAERTWRYFDREIYLPTGVSVSPEMSAAQELVIGSLRELESSTDLGVDYFIVKYDEDSILQPLTSETSYQGRNWRSFFQIWDDGPFNALLAGRVGTAPDQDVLVAINEKNDREFFVVARLACFVAGESCKLASQGQAKALVWRALGYVVGLRYGEGAASEIMKAGVSPAQETGESKKKFFAEFDNQLENRRNALPPPPGTGT